MSAKVLIFWERDIAEVFQQLLKNEGYCARIATSEKEAIGWLTDEKFDLLILSHHLPTGKSGDDFLTEYRADGNDDTTLTLMIESRDGRSGIIRVPLWPDQANGYIIAPFPFKDLLKTIEKLLAGLSTQQKPGDEGYTQYKSEALGIAFEYPTLWQVSGYNWIRIFGPWHHSMKANATLEVQKYLTTNPNSPYIIQEVINNRYGANYYAVRQVTNEHQIQIANVSGREAEYLWQMENYSGYPSLFAGRLIIAIVSQNETTYSLCLEAARDDFDDYRPVYAHLLKTFRFLS